MSAEVRLLRVAEANKPALYVLVDPYLEEMATFREKKVGPTCAANYEYLPLYWTEAGRHPFMIERDGRAIGFVLVRQIEERGQAISQMSEFSVSPAERRNGVGRAALELLFAEIPGHWELQMHVQNAAAMAFWPAMIERVAAEIPSRRNVVEADGRRVEYRFRVAPPR